VERRKGAQGLLFASLGELSVTWNLLLYLGNQTKGLALLKMKKEKKKEMLKNPEFRNLLIRDFIWQKIALKLIEFIY
jgi:hypothetical protein